MDHWITIVFLIFLNGYFVACEIVLVTARKTKIEEYIKKGKRRAKLVKIALENIGTYLPVTQVGVTLTSIALGIIASPILDVFIKVRLPEFLINFLFVNSQFSLLPYITFLTITYFQLTFGELIPKTIAMRQPERYSLSLIPPLFLISTLFKPLTLIVNLTTHNLLRLFGIKKHFEERPYSEDEIKMILSSSGKDGIISDMENEMTNNIFHLKKVKIKNIMIPRKEIIGFETNELIPDIKEKIVKNKLKFNRYPIYIGNLHNIIGFIHIIDIFGNGLNSENKNQVITASMIKRILYFNQRNGADMILLNMKRQEINVGVIVDDNRRTVGLVTMPDIIEQVIKSS